MSWQNKLKQLTQEYGIAWFIVNQILGLEYTDINLVSFIQDYVNPKLGNIALSFAFNRLGTPVRIVVTTALMPMTAEPINKLINPLLERFGIPTLYNATHDFPGVEGEEDKKAK